MSSVAHRPVPAGYRWFFLVAAVYDIALGLVFLVAGPQILQSIGMVLPPHIAYIQLAAVFVAVQGFGYWLVYRAPWTNLGLVRMGVAYKASYSGLTLFYLVTSQLPSVFFVPWAVVDFLFLVGFVLFLRLATRRPPG